MRPRQADRIKAVIALSRGWSAVQIAQILLFDEKTSRHYFERYQQGGLQALIDDNYSGAEPKLDAHQMSELEGYLEEHRFFGYFKEGEPLRRGSPVQLFPCSPALISCLGAVYLTGVFLQNFDFN